jgi:hypothetical protein
MKLGIFDGNLRFTVYRGTNLIQMDAIARTNDRRWLTSTMRFEGIRRRRCPSCLA